LQFSIKKILIFFSFIKIFLIFGHQNPGSRTGSGSAIRKSAGSGSALNQGGSALNQGRSATLLLVKDLTSRKGNLQMASVLRAGWQTGHSMFLSC
jgi:hypothetical protein